MTFNQSSQNFTANLIMRIRSFLAFVISICITFAFVPVKTFAFPLSEKANVLTGTKAKVIQSEITKAKKERILIIKVAVKLCDD